MDNDETPWTDADDARLAEEEARLFEAFGAPGNLPTPRSPEEAEAIAGAAALAAVLRRLDQAD
jgi:hypothetical protein